MCGFEIIAKPDKNKRDHLLKQLISIVSCRFCRAEYDNEILLPYHTSAVDKRGFFHVNGVRKRWSCGLTDGFEPAKDKLFA